MRAGVTMGAMGMLIRVVINAIALWITALLVPGIDVGGGNAGHTALTVLVVAVIFGVVNAILKPIIKVVGCVFYILTLGLIALVVNALLFLLTDWISQQFDLPFAIDGFWPAFWGAIVMAAVSWVLSFLVPEPRAEND
ncbi:putative membrane protein [Asanoa ferruginea]|uniref:Putative membrane protein n=2 Tax=Asanoa ferruginea TaxID=53367 RepID=A0A3D9ZI32_9ACTN|nr:putative membrane protein [Asanoa ferruginea]